MPCPPDELVEITALKRRVTDDDRTSFFQGDREPIHQMLDERGMRHQRIKTSFPGVVVVRPNSA